MKEVYLGNGKLEEKAFLLEAKKRGYKPRVLVTDLDSDNDKAVKSVFPRVIHHKCVFHAERAARQLVARHLVEYDEEIKNRLREEIRRVFASKKLKQFSRRYKKRMRQAREYPAAAGPIFDMLVRYERYHRDMLRNGQIPRTTNACERAIREFDLKYRNTMGYTSIHAVREYVGLWVVCERLVNGVSWRARKRGNVARDVPSITWDMWVLAA